MEQKREIRYLVYMGKFKVQIRCGYCGLQMMTDFEEIEQGKQFPVLHYCQKDFGEHKVRISENRKGMIFFPYSEGLMTALSTMN